MLQWLNLFDSLPGTSPSTNNLQDELAQNVEQPSVGRTSCRRLPTDLCLYK